MTNETSTDVAAPAAIIKLPAFCAADAATWFQRVEVQFRLKRETSDSRKADHVLAALPEETFPLISDWLTEQGDDAILYPALKEQILLLFIATPEERAEKLMSLTRLPLGDQRPSTAFLEMKALTKIPTTHNCSSKLDLLRVLWLMRLPDNIRAGITDFMDLTEQQIIKLADSLQGATRSVAPKPVLAAQGDDRDVNDSAEPAAAAYRRTQPHAPPGRNQQKHQLPNNPPSHDPLDKVCFYHRRFGYKAKNCQPPCAWAKNL